MPLVMPALADPLETAASPDDLFVQLITTQEGLCALRPEWERLYGVAGNDNPFSQWLWVWLWWQAFGRSGRFRRFRLHVCVLRDDDGQVRAIFPFVLTTWGCGPLAVRALRLYGFRDPMSELRAPLIWPGWEATAAATLMATLDAQARTYDWCVLDGLVAGEALSEWFHARFGAEHWEKPVPDCVLPLPATWEALRARLSRSMKDNTNYYPRLLQRDGHSWQFESVSDPAALPEALAEFLRLHSSRNTMPDAPPHADHFCSSECRQFLLEAAPALAAEGRLRVCRLRVGAAVVASQLVLVTDNSLYLSFSGFDPDWRRYSVMTLLTVECIKAAIAEGRDAVNLSAWETPNKLRWRPEVINFEGVRLYAPTRRARLAARLHRAGLSFRNRWR